MGLGTQGEESVGFLEPHILSLVLGQLVCERKRTWGSKNAAFSLLFYGTWYARGRERGVLRTPRSLSDFMAVGKREEENIGF